MWRVQYEREARKQYRRFIKNSPFDDTFQRQIAAMAIHPLHEPPAYEELQWDMKGLFSRRITRKDRIVYYFDATPSEDCEGTIFVLSCWGHYEEH